MNVSVRRSQLPSWRMLALRGAVALLFGILAALWPGLTLLWLVVLFSIYALFGGAVALVSATEQRKTNDHWWLVMLTGLVGIAAGAVALVYPALTALALVLLMGAYALATGILDLVLAVRLREHISREWLLILNGVVSVIFGLLVLLFPSAGALALVWLISAYAILTGILLLSLAQRVRARSGRGATRSGTPPAAPGTLATGSP